MCNVAIYKPINKDKSSIMPSVSKYCSTVRYELNQNAINKYANSLANLQMGKVHCTAKL